MKINWQEYLKQYNLVYEMPSRVWQDGIALGNGSLGVMAYEPFHPEWVINKNDVWDYRHPNFKRHTTAELREMVAQGKGARQSYIDEMNKESGPDTEKYPCPKTCGQLRIRFGPDSIYAPGHRFSKQLDLHTATLHTKLDKHLSHPRLTSFVCAEENLLIVQVRQVSAMSAFHNKVDLFRMPDSLMPSCEKGAAGDILWIDQPFHDGFRFVMMARIVPQGGKAYRQLFKDTVQRKWWSAIEPSTEISSQVEGEYAVASVAGDFDILLTVVTSLEAKNPRTTAKKNLDAAVQKGPSKLHAEHKRWWSGFWPKSYVGLAEPWLEQLWYISLYHLASSLRGTPVGGLCGLWFGPMDRPSQILPWMGYYTNDYNMQLPVTPVFRANHPELSDGIFRTLLQQLPGAKRNAREEYGLPGAFFPLGTDPTGEDVSNGPYRLIQNSGPYWCVFLWWHYLYTRDKKYLSEVVYPILHDVATFFAHYLVWHEDEQLYHLEISQQPELMYIDHNDPVDTMASLKYTFGAAIEATKILGKKEKIVVKWQHILDHYPEYYRVGKELPPLRGIEPNHVNHLRTLTGLYPCGEFDPELSPEWDEVCRFEIMKSDRWANFYACNHGTVSGYTGLVYHIGVQACWLGWKEVAWRYFEDLLKGNVKPNGLLSHNATFLADSNQSEENINNIPDMEIHHDLDPDPYKAVEVLNGRLMEQTTENLECKDTIFPAFEGPALYLLMVNEMLLQSQKGLLRLFAGLPDERDAAFSDLRAEGPTLVSAIKSKGKVQCVRLKALEPVRWKLKNPWSSKSLWTQSSRSSLPMKIKADRTLDLNLQRGEILVLSERKADLMALDHLQTRHGVAPQARLLEFTNGMVTWLGKPEPSKYYASLEKARKN